MTALAGQLQVHSTEEQAEVVAPWELNLRQISPGAFETSMQYASLGDIMIYRDCWSQRGIASCALPRDYFFLGAGAKPDNGIDWCGKEANEQTLALALPGTQVDFTMPSQTTYVGMLLPVRYLNTLLDDGKSHGSTDTSYHAGPGHGKRLIARMNWTIDHCLANPGLLGDPAQRNELEACLIDDLARLGYHPENEPSRMRISAKRKTLRLALEYCESIRGKISVPQFAEDLSVNQRSLELAFRSCLGITPRQYLHYRRLHGVHEELRRLPPDSRSITEVANNWGFTELGRFSGEYKKLFGELPSATLNRATARPPLRLVDLLR